jgi:hypothetical protein
VRGCMASKNRRPDSRRPHSRRPDSCARLNGLGRRPRRDAVCPLRIGGYTTVRGCMVSKKRRPHSCARLYGLQEEQTTQMCEAVWLERRSHLCVKLYGL